MSEKAGPEDSAKKFEEMFERRLEKGQQFHQPYFGCREFAARLEPLEAPPPAIDQGVERPLGMMLFDIEHNASTPHVCDSCHPLFFPARLTSGVVLVPTLEDVKKAAGGAT